MRRLEALSGYEFNAVEGEERSFMSKRWLAADDMVGWLRGGEVSVSSGDVYARLTAGAARDGEPDAGAAPGRGPDQDAGGSNDG